MTFVFSKDVHIVLRVIKQKCVDITKNFQKMENCLIM